MKLIRAPFSTHFSQVIFGTLQNYYALEKLLFGVNNYDITTFPLFCPKKCETVAEGFLYQFAYFSRLPFLKKVYLWRQVLVINPLFFQIYVSELLNFVLKKEMPPETLPCRGLSIEGIVPLSFQPFLGVQNRLMENSEFKTWPSIHLGHDEVAELTGIQNFSI